MVEKGKKREKKGSLLFRDSRLPLETIQRVSTEYDGVTPKAFSSGFFQQRDRFFPPEILLLGFSSRTDISQFDTLVGWRGTFRKEIERSRKRERSDLEEPEFRDDRKRLGP